MYIALDLGGTQIRIAASETKDTPSLNTVRKFSIKNKYQDDLQAIISTINELRNGKDIAGIGCGFPGVISEDKKSIVRAPNLSDWIGKSFSLDLERAFKCRVWMENDQTIAALGEATYGYGKDKGFVYITWGTGFAGAKVTQSNGQIQVRQFEAGHQILEWENGKLCGCGQKGCAEAYIGGGNIEKYYQKDPHYLTNEEWDEVFNHLANTLLNVIVFNPTTLIVLGGGIAIHKKENLEEIKVKVQERLRIFSMPEIQVTSLDDNVGLYGAFILIQN